MLNGSYFLVKLCPTMGGGEVTIHLYKFGKMDRKRWADKDNRKR